MDYTSPACIFFICMGLITSFSVPAKLRYWVLLALSTIWMLSWRPEWAMLYLCLQQLNYWVLKFFPSSHGPLIFFDLMIYFTLKSPFLVAASLLNPFGLSFFMFMLLGLVIDHWRIEKPTPPDWRLFTLMPSFFPLLMAGPIENGKHFSSELSKSTAGSHLDFSEGIIIFGLGFIRKFFLLGPVEKILHDICQIPSSFMTYLLIGFLATLVTYLQLSSYALMGRGIARCFGLNLHLSFRPVYFAKSPVDFWGRWNMSLGLWIRDYFTLPVLLKFGRRIPPPLLVVVAFLIVGIWHGVSWEWVIFGFYNGILVMTHTILEKKIRSDFVGRFLAWLILIGNGLILTNPGEIPMRHNFNLSDQLLHLFTSHFSYIGLGVLLVVILIDCIEEVKSDQDWYLRGIPLSKYGMSLGFTIVYLWALKADLIQLEEMTNLPLYFKI